MFRRRRVGWQAQHFVDVQSSGIWVYLGFELHCALSRPEVIAGVAFCDIYVLCCFSIVKCIPHVLLRAVWMCQWRHVPHFGMILGRFFGCRCCAFGICFASMLRCCFRWYFCFLCCLKCCDAAVGGTRKGWPCHCSSVHSCAQYILISCVMLSSGLDAFLLLRWCFVVLVVVLVFWLNTVAFWYAFEKDFVEKRWTRVLGKSVVEMSSERVLERKVVQTSVAKKCWRRVL